MANLAGFAVMIGLSFAAFVLIITIQFYQLLLKLLRKKK